MKSKIAAMEMSVGTIVTIVLLMGVLVLGGVLIQKIYFSSIENVGVIDQSVKNEISKLFNQDTSKKIIVYPATKLVSIEKGNQDPLGFAFSIRNTGTKEAKFEYTVSVNDPNIKTNCNINAEEAQDWIQAGSSGEITIPAGDFMTDPEFVRFIIPDNAPPCLVRFGIDVKKDGAQYSPTISVDINVKGK